MNSAFSLFEGTSYFLMRVFFGLLFACHGVQKLFGLLGGKQAELTSLIGVAGLVEFVAGLAIAVGIMTSWAAFLSAGQMAVAYFMAHAPDGFWPIQNRGELALLYCFGFLVIMSRGGGKWSVGSS
jgi:putative oxidoreductase